MEKQKLFVINHDYDSSLGIASYLLRTLSKLHTLNINNVYIDWTACKYYQNYGENKNLWDLIFYQPYTNHLDDTMYDVERIYSWTGRYGDIMKDNLPHEKDYVTRKSACTTISKYFNLKDDIKNSIDLFFENKIGDKKCLAVHRRACNVGALTGPCSTDLEYESNLLKIINSEKFDCAFICSDNKSSKDKLINFMCAHNIEPIVYNSQVTVDEKFSGLVWDNLPVDRNLLVKELITEIYLMSKCHSIIRTVFSGVSHFVLYLNPTIVEYTS